MAEHPEEASFNPHADWVRLTASAVVGRGPLMLAGLVLRSDGVGVADVTLREGANASARLITTFNAPSGESNVLQLPASIFLREGLFVVVGSNVSEVLVVFSNLRDVPRRRVPVDGE